MNNKGSVLITTIVILAFLSVLGINLVVYLLSRSTKTNLELNRLKAYYLAEAGIAKAIHELKIDKDLDNNGLGNVLRASLGGGTYKASHNYAAATITATGEYNNVQRAIQMKYSAL